MSNTVPKNKQQPLHYQTQNWSPLEVKIARILCSGCDRDVRDREWTVYGWHDCLAHKESIEAIKALIVAAREEPAVAGQAAPFEEFKVIEHYTPEHYGVYVDPPGQDSAHRERQRLFIEKAVRALAASPAQEKAESGWLVELDRGNGPEWLCYDGLGAWDWTKDSVQATRFARRQDANGVAGIFDGLDVRITEHQWTQPVERGRSQEKGESER